MAYSLIAHTSAGSVNSGTSVTTPGINTTGCDLVVVIATFYAGAPGTFSDSKGNTWSVASPTYPAASYGERILYCQGGTVGTGHTFTTGGTTNYPSIAVLAFSGSASTPFDQQSSGVALSTGSITPSSANELIVAALVTNASSAPSIDSGMTAVDFSPNVGGNSLGVSSAYKVQTAAVSISPTWTSGGGTYSCNVASFRAATPSILTFSSPIVLQAAKRASTY